MFIEKSGRPMEYVGYIGDIPWLFMEYLFIVLYILDSMIPVSQ